MLAAGGAVRSCRLCLCSSRCFVLVFRVVRVWPFVGGALCVPKDMGGEVVDVRNGMLRRWNGVGVAVLEVLIVGCVCAALWSR